MIWGGWDRISNALAGLYSSNCRAVHWHWAQFTEFSQGSDKKVLWAISNFTSLFSYSFQINSFRLKWLQVHHLPHHHWWSKHAQTWKLHSQKVEASHQSSSAVSFSTTLCTWERSHLKVLITYYSQLYMNNYYLNFLSRWLQTHDRRGNSFQKAWFWFSWSLSYILAWDPDSQKTAHRWHDGGTRRNWSAESKQPRPGDFYRNTTWMECNQFLFRTQEIWSIPEILLILRNQSEDLSSSQSIGVLLQIKTDLATTTQVTDLEKT